MLTSVLVVTEAGCGLWIGSREHLCVASCPSPIPSSPAQEKWHRVLTWRAATCCLFSEHSEARGGLAATALEAALSAACDYTSPQTVHLQRAVH